MILQEEFKEFCIATFNLNKSMKNQQRSISHRREDKFKANNDFILK